MKTQIFDGEIQFMKWPKGVTTMQCDGYTITRVAPRKPRHFVRMFKPQFSALVESGAKCQTVRPTPKRMPQPGDTISLRCWTGKPYRSKQRVLRDAIITDVQYVKIDVGVYQRAMSENAIGYFRSPEDFSIADGFTSWAEMRAWFIDQHGLPFTGIVIFWK